MKSLPALVAIVLTACAIAHPARVRTSEKQRVYINREHLFRDVVLAALITPKEFEPITRENVNSRAFAFRRRKPEFSLMTPEMSLLSKAIYNIGNMPERSTIQTESEMLSDTMADSYTDRRSHPLAHDKPFGYSKRSTPKPAIMYKKKPTTYLSPPELFSNLEPVESSEKIQKDITIFAFTPMDAEFFTPTENALWDKNGTFKLLLDTGEKKRNEDILRDLRQNPILKNAKTLVADDLDKLRKGVDSDDLGSTAETNNKDVVSGSNVSRETVYMLAISAGVTATIVLCVSLIAYGCYIMVKRAKAALAVDYPAYGVTGPTMNTSGDRRLAQSAQMYHYQHQKQQIIAMERDNVEQRMGSFSGLESDEENEEGDYTVYECPGFATTGDMEVRNPLYDVPTPAAPGKVQVLQTQLKE